MTACGDVFAEVVAEIVDDRSSIHIFASSRSSCLPQPSGFSRPWKNQSVPLLEGMPRSRASRAAAIRSARATPLNTDSHA